MVSNYGSQRANDYNNLLDAQRTVMNDFRRNQQQQPSRSTQKQLQLQQPALESEILLGACAPRSSSKSTVASSYMNTVNTTNYKTSSISLPSPSNVLFSETSHNRMASTVVTFRSGEEILQHPRLPYVSIDDNSGGENMDDLPTVRCSAPPLTLKLASSWSLPQLSGSCDTVGRPYSAARHSVCRNAATPMSAMYASAAAAGSGVTPVAEDQGKDNVEEREISQILDFLFVGRLEDAVSAEILNKHCIRRVLNVSDANIRAPQIPNDAEHFLRIPILDSNKAKLFPHFEETFKFIESARHARENVLVHCMAGISRSPTLAVAYLMRSRRMGYEEACRLVKRKRSFISPNMNFMGQLVAYEKALRAARILPPLDTGTVVSRHSYTAGTSETPVASSNSSRDSRSSAQHATVDNLKAQKTEAEAPIQRTEQPIRRPTCFTGLSMRNASALSKSCSSDFLTTALRTSLSSTSSSAFSKSSSTSSTTSSMNFSSSSTSLYSLSMNSSMSSGLSSDYSSSATTTKIYNENRKRIIDARLEPPRRPANLFAHSLPSYSSCSFSADTFAPSSQTAAASTTIRASGDNLLAVVLPKRREEILSPSTEFSKLDISLINPCFQFKRDDERSKAARGERRVSTSTEASESASSGVFTEASYNDDEDEEIYGREEKRKDLTAANVAEPSELLKTPCADPSPMFENPMFELSNRRHFDVAAALGKKLSDKSNSSRQFEAARKMHDSTATVADRAKCCKTILQSVMRKHRPQFSQDYHAKDSSDTSPSCSSSSDAIVDANFSELSEQRSAIHSRSKFSCYCCRDNNGNSRSGNNRLSSSPLPAHSKFFPLRNHCASVNRIRSILSNGRTRPLFSKFHQSILPTLKDDSDDDETSEEPEKKIKREHEDAQHHRDASTGADCTSDDGFSEKLDSVISDEEACLREKLVLKHINEQLGFDNDEDEDGAEEDNENLENDEFVDARDYLEKEDANALLTRKKRRIKKSSHSRESSGHETFKAFERAELTPTMPFVLPERVDFTSDSRLRSQNNSDEKLIHLNTNGIYPRLFDDEIQESPESGVFSDYADCEHLHGGVHDASTSIYPKIHKSFSDVTNAAAPAAAANRPLDDKLKTTTHSSMITAESRSTSSSSSSSYSSSSTTTTTTSTTMATKSSSSSSSFSSVSKQQSHHRKRSPKKPTTQLAVSENGSDAEFEAACRDPERASIGSASSLEIFVN